LKKLLVTFFLFSNLVWADSLRLIKTEKVLPFQNHQFQLLYENRGTFIDVSTEAHFETDFFDEISKGVFFIEPTTFAFNPFYFELRGNFFSPQGTFLRFHQFIVVDLTPDAIKIKAPNDVMTGEAIDFFAIGKYSEREIDLTKDGKWSVSKGSINLRGEFEAPIVDKEELVVISFSYANKTERAHIKIRP